MMEDKMLDRSLLEAILSQLQKKGADFAEIYFEKKDLSSIFCEDDRIEKINSGREQGAGIRVVKDFNTSLVYTNDISEAGLFKAAEVAAGVLKASAGDGAVISLAERSFSSLVPGIQKLPGNTPLEEKIKHVLAANNRAREYNGKIRQVTVVIGDLHKKIQIANTWGTLVEEERTKLRAVVNAIAEDKGIIQTGYESLGGTGGWELLEETSFAELAEKAAALAVKMLTARPAPAGKMAVVMSSAAGGTMVHEACGHGLEADLVQKGLSVYKDKYGQKVAAEGVSVIDDATLAGAYGSFGFDDEGNPAQRTVLIENGRLVQFMYDCLTAQKAKTKSTGNGRRESYQYKPIPRMSNTFIAPGKDDPGEIIESTRHGLLVKKMGGGQVNTTTGDFVFDVQEGYIIEDGKIKYPVRGATLTGNGPQVLLNIDRVGSDLGFAIGTCGKDGQGVPVSDAQPTIRIKELLVGGTAISGSKNNPLKKVIK
jgi:TldD protein